MIVVLVGLRRGQPERDRNWTFNRRRWAKLGWPIYEGYHEEAGPYCMAVASNRAAASAALAVNWTAALYVGADFYLPSSGQAVQAVSRALSTGRLTFAHDHLTLLEDDATRELVATGSLPDRDLGVRHPNTFSGVLAVLRPLWDAVGGFDERFVGWGWEDLAFWSACTALGGGFDRIKGDHYHLWHPRSHEENEGQPHNAENEALGRRYLAARNQPAVMRRILAERGV